MSFLSGLFQKQEDEFFEFNWIPLNQLEQLNEIKKISVNKTIAIFKHSTRCGISRNVISRFEKQFANQEQIEFYYLDLLNFREISNTIASHFNVTHQSPQLLIIKNGKVINHASHHHILDLKLT